MARSREALLDAAVDYVAAQGLADLSLRACASAIGTSHRMLSYHFGSREGLITAIADRAAQRARVVIERSASEREEVESQGGTFDVEEVVGREVRDGALMGLLPVLVEVTYLIMHRRVGPAADAPTYAGLVELWRPVVWSQLRLGSLPPDRAEARLRLAVAVTVGTAMDYAGTRDRAAYADMLTEWLRLAVVPTGAARSTEAEGQERRRG